MTTDPDPAIPTSDSASSGPASATASGWLDPGDPDGSARCAVCGSDVGDRFGWCSGCRVALCFPCGRQHFCRPTCAANGCHAGLCVREVRDGILSERWGLPAE